VKVFSPENRYVVEQAQVITNTEGSNEAIVKRRDGGYSTGVIVHGMLFKGFFSGTWENLCLPLDKGVLIAEGTRLKDEAQVVGSAHITVEAG
jgi:hypothetical protein